MSPAFAFKLSTSRMNPSGPGTAMIFLLTVALWFFPAHLHYTVNNQNLFREVENKLSAFSQYLPLNGFIASLGFCSKRKWSGGIKLAPPSIVCKTAKAIQEPILALPWAGSTWSLEHKCKVAQRFGLWWGNVECKAWCHLVKQSPAHF